MDNIELRQLSRLNFVDPVLVLPRLQAVRRWIAARPEIPDDVRNLRTHKLKEMREFWAAAIFAFLTGKALQTNVYVAASEASDYDFVCRWVDGEDETFTPVQLKEVVPENLNSETDVQAIIDGIADRHLYHDRCVAIKVTRPCHFDPHYLDLSALNVGSLWIFGALTPHEESWGLWGDLQQSSTGLKVDMPF